MSDERYIIHQGDSREVLKTLPDCSVHTCITSPPYFGLRDYGTARWEGGDPACNHTDDSAMAERLRQQKSMIAVGERLDGSTRVREHDAQIGKMIQHREECPKCGAKRIDSQIGLEETPDEYIRSMVELFREVRRVLRDDGTLWLNLGDSYASYRDGKATPDTTRGDDTGTLVPKGSAKNRMASTFVGTGIKHKDLIGIPWRVALALQADGWYLRQDIIWHKPNPMPESVTDRCTKAHEYIFLLSKQPRYYFDSQAIKEPLADASYGRAERKQRLIDRTGMGTLGKQVEGGVEKDHGYAGLALGRNGKTGYSEDGKRNKRSVWTVTTKPFRGAHFATFPEDLILPCVRAGTGEYGCCSKCGKPWEREVEVKRTFESGSGRSGNLPEGKYGKNLQGGGETKDIRRGPVCHSKTIGWIPSCDCEDAKITPCTVLDPFNGAATTGVVALKEGRRYIGIELNPDYIKLSEERIKEQVPETLTELFE